MRLCLCDVDIFSLQSVPPDSHSTPAVPSERLLALLHRRAEHQCLAALQADTRDQAESVQRYARLQERLCDALLNQHAQLELLRALLGAERGAHVRALAHTEQVAHSLKAEEATWASQRDEELARLQESLPKAQSEPSLSSKDPTISR